jgi:DNA-directed RNA polymerase specialized sigma24 family protein
VRAVTEHRTAASLEAVYREQRVGLVRLGYLLIGSRPDAEDLVQAAFASLAKSWDQVESPPGYLRQAVVNGAAGVHRRAKRQLPARPEPVVGEPVVDDTWNAVQRAVVVLRFYEDLPLTEIARVVGRPDSTVRSDLRRALQHLRQELNNDR